MSQRLPLETRAMRFQHLSEWLAWQESLHVQEIDLGLERCRAVADRLELLQPGYSVVTIAGTNGKGSSVALMHAVLTAAGYKVGRYMSPHLVRYNERILIGTAEVGDGDLCAAFERVDQARGDISLTYFEFGTLAALELFRGASLDAAVLEVGLGGRLDAVNLVDADLALITAIGIDHVDWLGPDRESIAREKAGVMRSGRPAVCSDPQAPASLVEHARELGSPLYRLGLEYDFQAIGAGWSWRSGLRHFAGLPRPHLEGDYQLQNAAGVLMALELLQDRLPVTDAAIREGLESLYLPGRFQVVPGPVEWVLDVAHNPQAAGRLARTLAHRPVQGRTLVVAAMLRDKDSRGVFRELRDLGDRWFLAGLAAPRGDSGEHLLTQCVEAGIQAPVAVLDEVEQALEAAEATARPGDRILVFGSFLTVGAALRRLGRIGVQGLE